MITILKNNNKNLIYLEELQIKNLLFQLIIFNMETLRTKLYNKIKVVKVVLKFHLKNLHKTLIKNQNSVFTVKLNQVL
jgi:hypothetical protein